MIRLYQLSTFIFLFQGIPGRDQGHAPGPDAEAPPMSGAPIPAAPTSGISIPANTGSSPSAGGGMWSRLLCKLIFVFLIFH